MRHISSYIQAIFFAVMFLLFISGSIGWALIYAIVGASVISAVCLLVSRKHFRIEAECVSGLTEKGDKAEILLTLTKTGFCFIPNLDITLCAGESDTISVHTALTFGKSTQIRVPIKTKVSGKNRCRVTQYFAQDFMNLLCLAGSPADVCAEYCVLPAYVEYKGPAVRPKLLPSEEETEEGKTAMSGGLPGYEHREYAAGDSLRRINYKLSAKRQKLMVRLDEITGSAPVVISVAENCFPEAGETLMALSRNLVLHGGTVRVVQSGDSFCANTPQTLSRLREWIATRPLTLSESASEAVISPETDVVIDHSGVRVLSV